MRIVYDENEKETIKAIYENYQRISLFDDNEPDRLYGLTFKVTNPSLAQYILINLLHDKLEELDLGIDVRSINFNIIQITDDIREKMHKMIDKIIDGEV